MNKQLVTLRERIRHPKTQETFKNMVPVTMRNILTPQRIERLLLMATQRSPALLRCTPQSIVKASLDLLSLGLDPSGILGEGYLVPYRDEATPIVGYRGYIVLARRSGQVVSVNTQLVHKHDEFEINLATQDVGLHKPARGQRGSVYAVYCIAEFNAGRHVEYMTADDVNAIRDRSVAWKSGKSTPWKTDWGQMARKTIIRRASHYWPMCTELAEAFAINDRTDSVLESDEPLKVTATDFGFTSVSENGPESDTITRLIGQARDKMVAGGMKEEEWSQHLHRACGGKEPTTWDDIESMSQYVSNYLDNKE